MQTQVLRGSCILEKKAGEQTLNDTEKLNLLRI
jgi:hypothetical protein